MSTGSSRQFSSPLEPKAPANFVAVEAFRREGRMDPVSAVGLWGLSLIGIGALVYAARSEAHHQRKLTSDDE
jgi:hypothetical protein